ncbi:MAG TPA: M20/M25/M40 family metallo-hydrolase, partial [Candidatus Binatia bacterium]|nr:M20/M25/M40 family metallo-hydrolase [Candidatus Binatia bacterium]
MLMRYRTTAVSAAALFFAVLFVPVGSAKDNFPASSGESLSAELARHARTLADDDMTGRGVDTPGIVKARDYIAAEFKKAGLAAGGDQGFFQRLEITTGVEIAGENAARLGDKPLELGRDWTPLGLSASESAQGELVFAGYGITATGHDYDDYAGIDAKGKIVVVLRYEPPPKSEESPFGKAPRSSRYAALSAKAGNARAHGAAGMVLVDLEAQPGAAEMIPLRRSMGRGEDGLVAIQASREAAERTLGHAGISLSELKTRIDAEEKPHSRALSGLNAALTVHLEKIARPSDNVVSVLRGSDSVLKDEVIVVGAHYDHLGFGHYGTMDRGGEGQIHHGADDNASGTAVMLSLAARFARSRPAPARTLVFVAFTGEELGLYGSRHFVAHPPFPIASIKAMINLDMVGRMQNNRLSVNSADTAKEFRAMIAAAAGGVDIEMKATGGGSDHVSFFTQGVPAIHFYTGMHGDYHRPSDTSDKLN